MDIVDQFVASAPITSADKEAVDTIKQLADGDPVLSRQVAEAIKKKLYSSMESEKVRAAELLDKLVDAMDLTFQQVVNEKEYLGSLEKLAARSDGQRVRDLFVKWVHKFADEQDILPNFALYHSRLVEQNLIEPAKEEAQVMDQFLINEAEGQDPEEFKQEVTETLTLFEEVHGAITSAKQVAPADEVSRREALISLAANLDRYSEQFGLWIEQLEPGSYMEEAMALNDRVTDALQRYKVLRSSSLQPTSRETSSSSEDSD